MLTPPRYEIRLPIMRFSPLQVQIIIIIISITTITIVIVVKSQELGSSGQGRGKDKPTGPFLENFYPLLDHLTFGLRAFLGFPRVSFKEISYRLPKLCLRLCFRLPLLLTVSLNLFSFVFAFAITFTLAYARTWTCTKYVQPIKPHRIST